MIFSDIYIRGNRECFYHSLFLFVNDEVVNIKLQGFVIVNPFAACHLTLPGQRATIHLLQLKTSLILSYNLSFLLYEYTVCRIIFLIKKLPCGLSRVSNGWGLLGTGKKMYFCWNKRPGSQIFYWFYNASCSILIYSMVSGEALELLINPHTHTSTHSLQNKFPHSCLLYKYHRNRFLGALHLSFFLSIKCE
jgi:hypothetical protein